MPISSEASQSAVALTPPLEQLAKYSKRVSNLCRLLETLADELPKQLPARWRQAAVESLVAAPQHFDLMTQTFFPLLLRRHELGADFGPFLRLLHKEYVECEASLAELQELLAESLTSGAGGLSPDALGYALRSFFDSIQRRTIWEQEVLLPLADRLLSAQDLKQISVALEDVNVTMLPDAVNTQKAATKTLPFL